MVYINIHVKEQYSALGRIRNKTNKITNGNNKDKDLTMTKMIKIIYFQHYNAFLQFLSVLSSSSLSIPSSQDKEDDK